MIRPTLIIGVGTSGLKIVENVQKYMYETLGMNSLPIFKYIYIETDRGQDIEPTPIGSDIKALRTYVPSLQATMGVLKDNKNLKMDWIPEGIGAQLASINAGAGGVRPGGRLALWAEKNFETIYREIEEAFNQIINPLTLSKVPKELTKRAGGLNENPVVYVVGTLCGGTNSGMGAIDIGYMVRKITGMQEGAALYAIFLLPSDGLNLPAGYGNAYGALKEIEFFRDPAHPYLELWPNGVQGDSQLPPYGVVYLVSPEYNHERLGKISSLNGLYRTVGLQVFVNLLGMSDYRASALVDALNQGFGFYSTFGISAIAHPRYALSEYIAGGAGMELCARWLHETHYLNAAGALSPINKAVVQADAAAYMDWLLESAFAMLDKRMESGSLRNELEEDVEKILTHQVDNTQNYLHGKFNSSSKQGYFAIMRGNLREVFDLMIEELHRKANEEVDRMQNLRMFELFLEGGQARLQRTLDLWSTMNIPHEVNQWNAYSQNVLANIMLWPNTLLFHRRATLVDRLGNLLNDLKIFCMRRIAQELLAQMQAGTAVSSRNNSLYLPSLARMKNFRQTVTAIAQKLADRRELICEEMKDTTVPILRVWRRGGFEQDAESAFELFHQKKGSERQSKEVTAKTLLKFLEGEDDEKSAVIAEEIKRAYQKETIDVIPEIDLLHAAEKRLQDVRNYAERAQAGLLRLHRGGMSGPGVPRFVISNSPAISQRLIDDLGGDFSKQQAKATDLLKQMIIFYEEKAQLNPLHDLKIIETLKRNFEQAPIDRSGKKIMPDEVWKTMRLAYSIDRRLLDIEAAKRLQWVDRLAQLLFDFAVIWEPDPATGESAPASVRHEYEALNIKLEPYPHFTITVPGKPYFEIKLAGKTADDKETVARERPAFDFLMRRVSAGVNAVGRDGMLALWNEEVGPRLSHQLGDTETKIRRQFYFGSADKPGLIDRLGAEKKDFRNEMTEAIII